MQKNKFQTLIWDFYSGKSSAYKKSKRDFPWRETHDPYKILVSEVMLQQTQTYRVIPKYEAFIGRFRNFKSLAETSNSEVLKYWIGLGYNRRAFYLKQTAQRITKEFGGKLPEDPKILQTLPGIGKNTAGAIVVFAFNKPYSFIETNIRRVFIHHFFKDSKIIIYDNEILPLIERTMDKKNPREWFYALMDYGAFLPNVITNPNRKSKHYTKQSKFEGSIRQIRGAILKKLAVSQTVKLNDLYKEFEKEKIDKALRGLEKEGFVTTKDYSIVLL